MVVLLGKFTFTLSNSETQMRFCLVFLVLLVTECIVASPPSYCVSLTKDDSGDAYENAVEFYFGLNDGELGDVSHSLYLKLVSDCLLQLRPNTRFGFNGTMKLSVRTCTLILKEMMIALTTMLNHF